MVFQELWRVGAGIRNRSSREADNGVKQDRREPKHNGSKIMVRRHLTLAVFFLVAAGVNPGFSLAGNCGRVIGYKVVGPSGVGPMRMGPVGIGAPMMMMPMFPMPLLPPRATVRHPRPKFSSAGVAAVARTRAKESKQKSGTDAIRPRGTPRQDPAERRHAERKRTAYVLDADSGTIRWSPLLEGDPFAKPRAAIASILAVKADSPLQLNVRDYRDAATAIAEMKETLQGMIHEIRPQAYGEANRFLVDLRMQLRLLADSAN